MHRLLTAAILSVLAAALVWGCSDSPAPTDGVPTNGAATNGAPTVTSFEGTLPPVDLVLETEAAAIGDEIRFEVSGWRDDQPLDYYLIPPETQQEGATGLVSPAKVALGQVIPEGGAASISFVLEATYEMQSGATLEITPGQKLYLLVLQGDLGRNTGPFVVE